MYFFIIHLVDKKLNLKKRKYQHILEKNIIKVKMYTKIRYFISVRFLVYNFLFIG